MFPSVLSPVVFPVVSRQSTVCQFHVSGRVRFACRTHRDSLFFSVCVRCVSPSRWGKGLVKSPTFQKNAKFVSETELGNKRAIKHGSMHRVRFARRTLEPSCANRTRTLFRPVLRSHPASCNQAHLIRFTNLNSTSLRRLPHSEAVPPSSYHCCFSVTHPGFLSLEACARWKLSLHISQTQERIQGVREPGMRGSRGPESQGKPGVPGEPAIWGTRGLGARGPGSQGSGELGVQGSRGSQVSGVPGVQEH